MDIFGRLLYGLVTTVFAVIAIFSLGLIFDFSPTLTHYKITALITFLLGTVGGQKVFNVIADFSNAASSYDRPWNR